MAIGVDLQEETRAFTEGLRALIETLPPIETVPVEATRRAAYEAGGIFPPHVIDRTLDALGQM